MITTTDIAEGRYLGSLCKRGHDWNSTGMSVRLISSNCCIECRYEYDKYWRSANVEKAKLAQKRYDQKPETKKRVRIRYANRSPEVKEKRDTYLKGYNVEYSKTHKAVIRENHRKYYKANKGRVDKYLKLYLKMYRATHLDEARAYYQDNKIAINAQRKIARNNIFYRLNSRISTAIRISLRGNKNGYHWEDLVGYTLTELMAHLGSLFTGGMTWENIGEWHIDHIIPVSAFNFTKPEDGQFRQCWALDNLQPLWAEENLRKGDELGYMPK